MASLPENDRVTGPFTALEGQTAFDGDFPLIDAPGDVAGSCVVFVRERDGVRSELTVTSDFTITTQDADGFTLTLTEPAEAGDRCHIEGRQKQKRLRAHPQGGAVLSDRLEADAREAAARAQEARRDIGRALLLGHGLSLKPPAHGTALASRVFGVNEAGDQIILVPNSSAAVAEDLAAAEQHKVDAEAAAATATTQAGTATTQAGIALAQAVIAAEASGEATAAEAAVALSVIAANLTIADAQALVDSLDAATLYPDIATGRAAVANGVAFKVGTIGGPGVEYYRRIDASTQSTLFTIPSATELGKRNAVVRCRLKSGGDGRNFVLILRHPWVVLPADRLGVIYVVETDQVKTFGSPSVTLRDYGDTVDLLTATPLRDAAGNNTLIDADLWPARTLLEFPRDDTTNFFHLVQRPNLALKYANAIAGRDLYEIPSPVRPVMVERKDDGLLIKAANITYDDPARRSNGDFTTDKIVFAGQIGMSLGAFDNPYAPVWHWSEAEVRGRRYRYGQIGSRHTGSGNFDRIQPSTDIYALRVGPLSETNLNAVSGGHPVHDFLGRWHGNLEEFYCAISLNVYPRAVSYGDGATTTIPVGFSFADPADVLIEVETAAGVRTEQVAGVDYNIVTTNIVWIAGHIPPSGARIERHGLVATSTRDVLAMIVSDSGSGSELMIDWHARCYMPYVAVEGDKPGKWIGEVRERIWIDRKGRHWEAEFDIGQRLEITAGEVEIQVGDIIEGVTSGATAYVCLVPEYGMTGDWGDGDMAGTILVDVISGTFEAGGEDIEVASVLVAHAEGPPSGEVSEQNGYSNMLIGRAITRAKAQGYAAIVVGREDARDLTLATGADGVNKDSASLYFDDGSGNPDGGIIYEVLMPEGPATPPGDFSNCTTSVMTCQDRVDVVKVYPGVSSGTAPRKWARRTTIRGTYRWRDGAVV